jgi:cytochrome c553
LFPANDCNAQNTGDNWKAPAKYKSMVNKYKATKDADGVGKSLWVKHCASCHGKEGYGDGKKSGELETEMRDITSKKFRRRLMVNYITNHLLVRMKCLTLRRKFHLKKTGGYL